MEDKILDVHPTLGFITYKDLINDLESILEDVNLLDNIFSSLLEHCDMTEEDISTFFHYDVAGRLEWIIFVLKGLL